MRPGVSRRPNTAIKRAPFRCLSEDRTRPGRLEADRLSPKLKYRLPSLNPRLLMPDATWRRDATRRRRLVRRLHSGIVVTLSVAVAEPSASRTTVRTTRAAESRASTTFFSNVSRRARRRAHVQSLPLVCTASQTGGSSSSVHSHPKPSAAVLDATGRGPRYPGSPSFGTIASLS
jgi:hypothetical protein